SRAVLSHLTYTRFRERFERQLMFEFFNAFNHPRFSGPGFSIGTATAGVISTLLFNSPMRQIQIAMKLSFLLIRAHEIRAGELREAGSAAADVRGSAPALTVPDGVSRS